uniref:Uncharacterized protein n=1 Tax=Anguilla anguilla TaxID=7936 RepID=A0A0E9PRZ3_ANGAN
MSQTNMRIMTSRLCVNSFYVLYEGTEMPYLWNIANFPSKINTNDRQV